MCLNEVEDDIFDLPARHRSFTHTDAKTHYPGVTAVRLRRVTGRHTFWTAHTYTKQASLQREVKHMACKCPENTQS